jgi:hypothetical protein
MQRQEQTHGIDHVPDRDRRRERLRPNRLRIIWKRIGERRRAPWETGSGTGIIETLIDAYDGRHGGFARAQAAKRPKKQKK